MGSSSPATAPTRRRAWGGERQHVVVGTFLEGLASGHWRDPRYPADGNSNVESFIEFATIAEEGGLDFGFIADTAFITEETAWHILSRLEPITALSALATRTSHLGLVGTVSTSFTRPFDVARQIASLDRLSGGRAGWNVVTSYIADHAANYGEEKLPDKPERYRIATEFVQVVKGLWRSWEPDAFVRDRDSGVYAEWSKVHTLNHKGEYFTVKGPLNVERSVQGEPVVFQAGASADGFLLAGAEADATFVTAAESLEHGRQRYAEWKKAAARAGRNPDHLLVLQVLNPVVGLDDDEAWKHYEERTRYIDTDHALGVISRYFQYFDFSTVDVDGPFPDDFIENAAGGFTSYAEEVLKDAEVNDLSIREAALRHVRPDPTFVGSADKIADRIATYFHESAFDGVILTLDKENLRRFTQLVVPRLQAKGIFREDYPEHNTLRDNLGLPSPKL